MANAYEGFLLLKEAGAFPQMAATRTEGKAGGGFPMGPASIGATTSAGPVPVVPEGTGATPAPSATPSAPGDPSAVIQQQEMGQQMADAQNMVTQEQQKNMELQSKAQQAEAKSHQQHSALEKKLNKAELDNEKLKAQVDLQKQKGDLIQQQATAGQSAGVSPALRAQFDLTSKRIGSLSKMSFLTKLALESIRLEDFSSSIALCKDANARGWLPFVVQKIKSADVAQPTPVVPNKTTPKLPGTSPAVTAAAPAKAPGGVMSEANMARMSPATRKVLAGGQAQVAQNNADFAQSASGVINQLHDDHVNAMSGGWKPSDDYKPDPDASLFSQTLGAAGNAAKGFVFDRYRNSFGRSFEKARELNEAGNDALAGAKGVQWGKLNPFAAGSGKYLRGGLINDLNPYAEGAWNKVKAFGTALTGIGSGAANIADTALLGLPSAVGGMVAPNATKAIMAPGENMQLANDDVVAERKINEALPNGGKKPTMPGSPSVRFGYGPYDLQTLQTTGYLNPENFASSPTATSTNYGSAGADTLFNTVLPVADAGMQLFGMPGISPKAKPVSDTFGGPGGYSGRSVYDILGPGVLPPGRRAPTWAQPGGSYGV